MDKDMRQVRTRFRIGFVKYGKYFLVCVWVVLFLSSAFPQEEVIVLEHRELAPHQRPPVRFHHENHATVIDCLRCHHEYDQYGNNVGGEGQDCSNCHEQEASAGNAVSLVTAFHIQCKSCHQELLSKGEKTGPLMCGQCHVSE